MVEMENRPETMKVYLTEEYEELIKSMGNQLNVYEEEHTKLKEELENLLQENQALSQKLNYEFKQKLKDEHIPKIVETEMVANLKNQLELCKREKEKTFELYQTSSKLIEKLEEEIRNHDKIQIASMGQEIEGRSASKLCVLEARLKNTRERLEAETSNREHLESENHKLQTEMAKLLLNLTSKKELIEDLKEKDRKWKEKYSRMEQEYTLLNATLECVLKSRNDLENKLDTYSNKIRELTVSYEEAKIKVGEALDVVEKAVQERDASIKREVELQKEATKLQLCLRHVIDQAGKKVSEELIEAKKKYSESLQEVLTEIPGLKSKLEDKSLELRRMTKKFKRLEKAVATKLDKEKISLIKGAEAEIVLLESQLDNTYKELEKIKIKNMELTTEKTRAENELRQLEKNYQILLTSKEQEEKRMEEDLKEVRNQMQKKVEELAQFSKKMKYFLQQIQELQTEKKNLTRLVEVGNVERAKLKKTIAIRSAQTAELENHVESLKKMNGKWKNEINGMTEEFEMRIAEVKKECYLLKRKNKEFVKELNVARKAMSLTGDVR